MRGFVAGFLLLICLQSSTHAQSMMRVNPLHVDVAIQSLPGIADFRTILVSGVTPSPGFHGFLLRRIPDDGPAREYDFVAFRDGVPSELRSSAVRGSVTYPAEDGRPVRIYGTDAAHVVEIKTR